MKKKKILKLFSWVVPFAPAITYGLTQFPLVVHSAEEGWSVTIGAILILLVLGPLFLSKQKLIKSRTIIFISLFAGFLLLGQVVTQLTWIFGLTAAGVGIDEAILVPWIERLEEKENVK